MANQGIQKESLVETKEATTAKQSATAQANEAPENGIKGLKHWRQDMLAGLVVALVSVPLSLGIALASGAPAVCGLTSEIIAGLVFPFLGGAYVTVSGPAAGLAPVLFAAITALGEGDMQKGYHLVVGVIMLVGIVQIVLTKLNAARFCQVLPLSAVHGMLAAIGFLIIGKQIPNLIGHQYKAHEFFAVLAATPGELAHMTPSVFFISCLCLTLLFVLTKFKRGFLGAVPPQLIVVLIGLSLGQLFHLDEKYLVKVPSNPFAYGFVFPDLGALFADPKLIPTVILMVVALTLVDGTESLATMQAVDRIDPFRRKSNPSRTLFAMGVSNMCSSLIGGLTIIPGMIKSSTGIFSGARTAWVNFYNAIFLILFLVLGSNVINMIPVGVLAAVLVHIGYKLAGPHNWKHVASLGREQLAIFSVTVVTTLCSDLLLGIGAGMLTKVIVLLLYELRCDRAWKHEQLPLRIWHSLVTLFRDPILAVERRDDAVHVYFAGALNCFNSLKLRAALDQMPSDAKKVRLHFTSSVVLIDHSMNVYLNALRSEWAIRGWEIEMDGIECLKKCSQDDESLKYRPVSPLAA